MARDGQGIRERYKTDLQETEHFNSLLKEAHDKPWWRALMGAIEGRHQGFLAQLVAGNMSARDEDVTRGHIQECDFFIAIDKIGDSLVEQMREEAKRNGRQDGSA